MEETEPGWYPDPTGRHMVRYWNGEHWSKWVRDLSTVLVDRMRPASSGSSPTGSGRPWWSPGGPIALGGAIGVALGLGGWATLGFAETFDDALLGGFLLFIVGPIATVVAAVGLVLLSRDAPPSETGIGMDPTAKFTLLCGWTALVLVALFHLGLVALS